MKGMQTLVYRSALMRVTHRAGGEGCRVPTETKVEVMGRTTEVVELGYFCATEAWAPDPKALVPQCGTEGCVMHLGFDDPLAADEALVAAAEPERSLADWFRLGMKKGWFKGGHSYAA